MQAIGNGMPETYSIISSERPDWRDERGCMRACHINIPYPKKESFRSLAEESHHITQTITQAKPKKKENNKDPTLGK
jgi:hypothetical protein